MVQYTKKKFINVIHYKKSHKIISLDAEKAFVKNTTSIHVKSIGEIRHSRCIPKYNKNNIQQIIANTKLNVAKLKATLLKSGTRQGCPLSSYLFNIVLEVLARAIRQQKEFKGIQIRKEEDKISLFIEDVTD